jgi:hypothetical protein
MSAAIESLTQQLELVDQLLAGRSHMFEPQDLPGGYGRVIKSLDHLLQIVNSEAVLAGGWAVWRHGFHGRMTQDVDIVLPADRIEEFLRAAAFSGFQVLPQPPGRWPKVMHKETDIKLAILPEGERPGTASNPAPTTLPHPSIIGAAGAILRYITLPALIELKLAAGRPRDDGDLAELIRANPKELEAIRAHLASVHSAYLAAFDRLAQRAREQRDE